MLRAGPLSFPFQTPDPFIFCVFHQDLYPPGDLKMCAPIKGTGNDFDIGKKGYRMYHGENGIPGFPGHPHRGFETITVTLNGYVDHTDSMGASGRYGDGDCQWMTAGRGIQHGEMFPLIYADKPNPLKLYQIWINLPGCRKMCEPEFCMAWSETIQAAPGQGGAKALVYAGSLLGVKGPAPPKNSWAADPHNDVGVFVISLPFGSSFSLPPCTRTRGPMNRSAYLVLGNITVDGESASVSRASLQLDPTLPTLFSNAGDEAGEVLILQGAPIDEPVVSSGPFVMNSQAEITQAFSDYRKTRFGGWPWPSSEIVFPREQGRFAVVTTDGVKTTISPPIK